MVSLDNLPRRAEIDPEGMLDLASSMADLAGRGFETGRAALNGIRFGEISSVAFCGMGGSAIAGDLLSSTFEDSVKIPFSVRRDYYLPGFVEKNSLVICSSYSGNTEETLSVFREALEIEGVRILTVASGGELLEQSKKKGLPHVELPSGMRPRAALGSSLFSVLGALSGVKDEIPGFKKERVEAEVSEALEVTGKKVLACKESSPEENNPAKLLAKRLHGKAPIVYSSASLTHCVGIRWKNQFEENAKTFCHANRLPELNHNEIEGYKFPESLRRDARVLFLRDRDEGERNSLRVEATRVVLTEAGIASEELSTEGKGPLSRTFSLICLGDHASIYLAFLNGVDPAATLSIDRLKFILAKRR
ncbi:MAG: bifunctional phosphoglucose/phosphomannose isomerase [Candidatus Eisenbacteria bacterium]|nr:bifunctional phosphoglucose/phosphomannose isomerase [Candidatus Eisenbacteria bacterium]